MTGCEICELNLSWSDSAILGHFLSKHFSKNFLKNKAYRNKMIEPYHSD